MISKDKLYMMKPTGYLINTSRGEVVDEDALADVLEEGRIAGAGLDVFGAHTDGPKRGSKILSLPNVVLTPHLAGSTAEAIFRSYYINSLENIVRTVRKEKPLYVVR
jgi:phosphoglycerate dehydrogenase-like enzyme